MISQSISIFCLSHAKSYATLYRIKVSYLSKGDWS